jgi:hypothetical protein
MNDIISLFGGMMPAKQPNEMDNPKGGVLKDITLRIKLVLRLMTDPRVNILLKAIPVVSLLYLIGFPDLAPGPVDDAGVIWLGMVLFVELCPPDVVEEHKAALKRTDSYTWQDQAAKPQEVIDADFREKN